MSELDTDKKPKPSVLRRLWDWLTTDSGYMFDEEYFARLGPKPASEIDRLRVDITELQKQVAARTVRDIRDMQRLQELEQDNHILRVENRRLQNTIERMENER